MPALTSPGIGTGLDVNSIISQLMSLERIPLRRLQTQESSYQTQISDYGKLKSAISTFEDAMSALGDTSKFQVFSATSADEDIYTATASSSASVGNYDIEVETLAESHKLNSAALADADTTTVGTAGDKLSIQVGVDVADTFTVDIGDKTLNEIRDEINTAADNKGVTATVIQEDAGHRLIITSDETGTANALTTATTDVADNPIADPLSLANLNTAVDAVIKVDGFTATRSSNTITDVIQGVTLNLKAAHAVPGTTANLSLSTDTASVKDSIQEFADAYNALRSTIDSLKKGSLEGDSTLRSIEQTLHNILNNPSTGLSTSYSYLSEVGVLSKKTGDLEVDSTALDKALATDFDGVAELFGNSVNGFAYRFETLASDLLDPNGLIDARTDGLDDRVDTVQSRIDREEYRMVTVEQRLRDQYAALDAIVGQLSATGSYLNQQLSALVGL